MENQTLAVIAANDYSSNVDTSRPFRSVKEAVAIFGERLLVGEIYPTRPLITYDDSNPCKEIITSWKYSSPSPSPGNPKNNYNNPEQEHEFFDTLKKLEAELEETKMELKLLKERESETEIALATLNAELHKNMSKLAEAEAAAAAKKADAAEGMRTTTTTTIQKFEGDTREEEMKRELMIRMENSPTLAQILSLGENDRIFGGKKEKKMTMKKKPIVPLVTDLLFKKKGSSTTVHNPLYASTNK